MTVDNVIINTNIAGGKKKLENTAQIPICQFAILRFPIRSNASPPPGTVPTLRQYVFLNEIFIRNEASEKSKTRFAWTVEFFRRRGRIKISFLTETIKAPFMALSLVAADGWGWGDVKSASYAECVDDSCRF